MSVRSGFEKDMEQLHLRIIRLGGLVEEAINKSIASFEKYDHDLAQTVINDDKQIDDLEREVEAQCMRLLLRQQPVAKDLRAISAALKIVSDMERMGDHATEIAEISQRLRKPPSLPLLDHIPLMAHLAESMVKDSVNAYVHNDMALSHSVIERDDEVDQLFRKIQEEIIALLVQNKDDADETIDLLMIAKYIERIADHAESVADWVIFFLTGSLKNKPII
ncbi:MAG TPA: phosphate transport system regulatory protein PhoU [Ruminococcaceae bacterium]|nr:phosphate transport system regulatory protein PhoU [Oscillospiraceae bacterium]